MVYEGRQQALQDAAREAAMVSISPPGDPTASPSHPPIPTYRAISSIAEAVEAEANKTASLHKSGWTAQKLSYWGFLWLIVCAGLLVIRMLLDTSIVRRPLLDPNLSSGGMLFLGTSS